MKKTKKKAIIHKTRKSASHTSKNSKKQKEKNTKKLNGDFFIGVDIGGTYVKAGLVVLSKNNAKLVKESKRLVEAKLGKETSLSNIFLTVQEVMPIDKGGKDGKKIKIKGIGIGFPAPIINGVADEATNMPGWEKTNIKKEFEKKFKIKTFVDNDANCFTLAEANFGAAKGKQNVIGITLGTGVGSGIIIEGKLYGGSTGAAGEIGRALYKDRMLEQSVNISALRFMSLMDPMDLQKKIKEGDDFAKYVLSEYGKELGKVMSIVVNFYNPEMVVIGGGLSNFFENFETTMNSELQKQVFRQAFNKVKITKAKLNNSGVIGAALLAKTQGNK
ncbi:MAG: ROK family protein [Nanoarchaeota archaeon]|nr:ROK family protein [Nanoarchaeota archaeon]